MVYSKDDNEVYIEQKVVRTAGAGLPLLISFFYFMESKHKLLGTRRLSQEKWQDIISPQVKTT